MRRHHICGIAGRRQIMKWPDRQCRENPILRFFVRPEIAFAPEEKRSEKKWRNGNSQAKSRK